jgi:hypothetical protein
VVAAYSNIQALTDLLQYTPQLAGSVPPLVVALQAPGASAVAVRNGPTVNGVQTTEVASSNGTFAPLDFADTRQLAISSLFGTYNATVTRQLTINSAAGATVTLGGRNAGPGQLLQPGSALATLGVPVSVVGDGTGRLVLADATGAGGIRSFAASNQYTIDGGSISQSHTQSSFAFVGGRPSLRTTTSAQTVTYSGVAGVEIDAGRGTNTFAVRNTTPGVPLTVHGGGGDTLIGPDADSTWQVTGPDAGTLDGWVTFSSVANLTGGAENDTFQLLSGASVSGHIDGGGGFNTLDYTRYSSPFTVDLTTGSATGVYGGAPGGISNIQNVLRPHSRVHATALTTRSLWIDGVRFAPDAPLQMAPGTHSIQADGGDPLTVFVAADGTVSYDPSLEGVLTGAGTGDLTIQGRTVTLDASNLSAHWLWVDGIQLNSTSAFSVNLLPGQHTFHAEQGDSFSFTVTAGGVITDPAGVLSGFVSGLGTSTLTILGRVVRMDATALEQGVVWIDGIAVGARQELTFTLLPGPHYFFSHNTNGNLYYFTVADDGTIAAGDGIHPTTGIWYYAPSGGTLTPTAAPASVVSVDPTNPSRLLVTGVAVTIDVSARPDVRQTWIDGVPYAIAPRRTFHMLPGPHDFTFLTSSGNSYTYHFTVADDGTFTSVSAPPGVLVGDGNTLRLLAGGVALTP